MNFFPFTWNIQNQNHLILQWGKKKYPKLSISVTVEQNCFTLPSKVSFHSFKTMRSRTWCWSSKALLSRITIPLPKHSVFFPEYKQIKLKRFLLLIKPWGLLRAHPALQHLFFLPQVHCYLEDIFFSGFQLEVLCSEDHSSSLSPPQGSWAHRLCEVHFQLLRTLSIITIEINIFCVERYISSALISNGP